MRTNDRNEIVAAIKNLCDGVGPFVTIDPAEHYFNMQQEMYDSCGDDSFDVLVGILLEPPDWGRFDLQDIEFELQEALTAVGRRNAHYALDRTRDLLGMKNVRPVIINMIGGLEIEEGLSVLEPLIELDQLSEDELNDLACAIGEIGGGKATELLEKMKIKFIHHSPRLLDYIESGIKYSDSRKLYRSR